MTAPWREFEQLVARIERIAAGKDATVRSPDRIRDKVTGRSRPVDASIRQRIGSTEILILVECRRRRHKDDVTWVEELVQRRESLGAATIIAVSASGFSSQAQSLAELKGILLRRLKDLTDQEIDSLLTPCFHVRPRINIAEVEFGLAEPVEPTEGGESPHQTMVFDLDEPLLYCDSGGRLSVNAVLQMALDTEGIRPFDNVPKVGSAILKDIRLTLPRGWLRIDTRNGRREVAGLFMRVWFYLIRERVSPTVALQYSRVTASEAPSSIRHSEYEFGGQRPTRLTLQEDDEAPDPRIAVEIRDEEGQWRPARLEFVRGGRVRDGQFEEWGEQR